MSETSIEVWLEDIIDAIDRTIRILNGRDFDQYINDETSRLAIERCLEIVSEASRRIPGGLLERHPAIKWHAIRAIGNILRHEYGRVDDFVIWQTASVSMPELRGAVVSLLAHVKTPYGRDSI